MDYHKLESFYCGHSLDSYQVFGAHLTTENRKGVRFTVYAPNAQQIQVLGEFNDWGNENKYYLEKIDSKGTWSIFVPGVKENDLYKYRITQSTGRVVDKMDPYAFYSELRPNTASVVTKLDGFPWSDANWLKSRNKGFHQPINIYEMHLGSWKMKEDGTWFTYDEIADDLIQYVTSMNYTHIEVMPLNEYPFDGSWGYQSSGYYSATSRYGSCEELKRFINKCHKAGIGVILDFVPVHFVKDDFSLSYFDGTALYEYEHGRDADSQWGTANFDLWKEEVRSFLMSAANFWLDIYHIDGLRMDAISNVIFWHGNKDNGVNEGALDFIRRMNYNLNNLYPDVMLIAEDSSDFPNVTKSTLDSGLGFDYKWDLGWMNDTLKYLSMDPVYRRYHHNMITFSMAYFYSENFILPFSHDEVVHGKATIVNKMWGSYEQKFAQARALYTYMFTHPGKKLNFMGNEIAQFREWDEQKENDWFLLTYPAHDSFKQFISKLNDIYRSESCLSSDDFNPKTFEWIDADNASMNLYTYERKDEDSNLVVILNMSPNHYQKYKIGVSNPGVYEEIINSEDTIYSGCGITNTKPLKARKMVTNRKPYTIEVEIAPFVGIILRNKR